MADENETADVAETAKPKKQAASKREILDSSGAVQDDWTGAAGIRYTSLADEFPLTVMFDDLPAEIQTGLMAFGALTLAGNVTNSVRNGDRKSDGPQTEKEALLAWLDNLKSGNWTSPRGEVEAGIGLLAEAIQRDRRKQGREISIEDITAKLKTLSKDEKAAVRKEQGVKVAMLEIQLERAAKRAAESGSTAASGLF